jgi:hypothetical protein
LPPCVAMKRDCVRPACLRPARPWSSACRNVADVPVLRVATGLGSRGYTQRYIYPYIHTVQSADDRCRPSGQIHLKTLEGRP